MSSVKKHQFNNLNGYRGFLASVVLIEHSVAYISNGDWKMFKQSGNHIGVNGFFVLSAFLLTYHLLEDLSKAPSNTSILLRIVQYFLRRFFRIYVVFILFWIMIRNEPTKGYLHLDKPILSPLTKALTLSGLGGSHLWTIPPEIRYYFFIPVIGVITHKCRRFWFLPFTAILAYVVINQVYNPFGFTNSDYWFENGYKLYCRLPIFVSGSLLAIFFFNIKSIGKFEKFIDNEYTQNVISVLVVIVFFLQFRLWSSWNTLLLANDFPFRYLFKAALYQCAQIFLLILCRKPNMALSFYNSSYMTASGKFSFGIYLFHPAVIHYAHQTHFAFDFEIVIYVHVISFLVAMAWFYVLENNLIKVANYLCRKIELKWCFRLSQQIPTVIDTCLLVK